jgi:hypothetical protein
MFLNLARPIGLRSNFCHEKDAELVIGMRRMTCRRIPTLEGDALDAEALDVTRMPHVTSLWTWYR